MAKKISDILGLGLLLVGIWVLLSVTNLNNSWVETIKYLSGLVGSIILIFSQAFFLWEKWR